MIKMHAHGLTKFIICVIETTSLQLVINCVRNLMFLVKKLSIQVYINICDWLMSLYFYISPILSMCDYMIKVVHKIILNDNNSNLEVITCTMPSKVITIESLLIVKKITCNNYCSFIYIIISHYICLIFCGITLCNILDK